jgi:HPr kinase/phosphorylase
MTTISRHGVFITINRSGVLIVGRSGIGKSELALHLLDRGHSLVADDAPLLSRADDHTIFGQCPEVLQDFLNVYGLGILNIRRLYGDGAIIPQQRLDLIIRLENDPAQIKSSASSALNGFYQRQQILGIPVPELTMLVKSDRDHALLVECAVRDLQLRNQGYTAGQDLQTRLSQVIARQSA